MGWSKLRFTMKTMTVFSTLLLGTLLCIFCADNCTSSPSTVNSNKLADSQKMSPIQDKNVVNGTATLIPKTVRTKRQITLLRCLSPGDHRCWRDCQCGHNRNCSPHGWCQNN
ncbi:Hepcidin-1 [Orchesella cincta]|uniref:Hepcidin-1 n=1 Tax=Orchesella cincta TaxID=48709 RepID=A0A1D2MD51_ORCCI|nr:Hepcidin-1 [Orchesella cincta]